MIRHLKVILAISICISLTGCGKSLPLYEGINLDIEAFGTKKIVVATLDDRPYVKSQNKTDKFIGIIKGGYGIPISVETTDGQALAKKLSETIKSSLNKKGFRVIVNSIDYHFNQNEAHEFLVNKENADIYLLLFIHEWKSHTRAATSLTYDLKLNAYNNLGIKIVSKSIQGRENSSESSLFNPWGIVEKFIPQVVKNKLETLLNDKEIRQAISNEVAYEN